MTVLQYLITFLSSAIITDSAKEFKKYDIHPTYVAVAQIDFNSQDKFVTILCKTFKDDMEAALLKQFSKKESIANPLNEKILSGEIETYIKKHLQLKINKRSVDFSMLNYQMNENNAVAMYFRIDKIDNINSIEITDTIFYELYDSEIQIIYVTVNGNRKSNKLRNPASQVTFEF